MAILWIVCLAVGTLFLTVEVGHAHEDFPPSADANALEHDTVEHLEGVVGHCHSGASCGALAILSVTGRPMMDNPAGGDLNILHQSLSTLVDHNFEPPPPRNPS